MTGPQARAARGLLGLSLRQVGEALGYSPMTISKLESDTGGTAEAYFKLMGFYQSKGLAFYAGGVIQLDRARKALGYADPIRERLMKGKAGSVYVAAFDALVEAAAASQTEVEEDER